MQEKGIELHEGVRIVAVEDRQLLLDSQQPEAYDECLWCTQAAAPAWLRGTDLTLGELLTVRMSPVLWCSAPFGGELGK